MPMTEDTEKVLHLDSGDNAKPFCGTDAEGALLVEYLKDCTCGKCINAVVKACLGGRALPTLVMKERTLH